MLYGLEVISFARVMLFAKLAVDNFVVLGIARLKRTYPSEFASFGIHQFEDEAFYLRQFQGLIEPNDRE